MSKAYEEYIQNRTCEIIESDEVCNKLNSEILILEKELWPLLSQEAQAKYLKIDRFSAEIIERICILLSRQFYDNYDKIPIIIDGKISRI